MKNDIVEAFTIQQSGSIGQVILGQDGRIIAWTTDSWIAQVICKLLTENEHLLGEKDSPADQKISGRILL